MDGKALGVYGIAFFFFQLFTVVSYKGLDVFFGKEVAHKRGKPDELSPLINEFLVSIVYGATISGLAMLGFSLFYHKINFTLLLLSLLTGILYALERNLGGFLLGKEKVAIDAFYMFLSFLFVLGGLLFFKQTITIEKIFLVRIGSFALGVFGRWFAVKANIPLAKITWKLKHFAEIRFYWLLVLCVFAERHIDIFILSFFIKEELLGGYFLSLSIYRTMSLGIEVVAQALTPFISRVFQGKEAISFRRFINILFVFSLLLGIIMGSVLLFTREWIVQLFNENLVASCSPFLKILAFAVPLKVVIYILGSIMSSTTYQKARFYINLVAVVLFIIALPVTIHYLSALGAVWTRAGFEVAVFAASCYFAFFTLQKTPEQQPII